LLSGRASTQGLTLIELTIVLLLMAILASFAIPRLLMVTEVNLRTSTRKLAETLRLVSSMATRHSSPFGIRYDMDKQKYCYTRCRFNPTTGEWVTLFGDESAEVIETDASLKTKCFTLKDGVYFKEIETLSGVEQKQQKGTLTHHYSPRGITDPLLIHLGDKKGRFYTLFLNRYAGRVEIRNGKWTYKDYLQELLE